MSYNRNVERERFATDDLLAYPQSRKRFSSGERLTFDMSYRYAHLPLINPKHALSVHNPGSVDYSNGRYAKERYSLVIPVAHVDLMSSHLFRQIDNNLRDASFSSKVAFDLCVKRQQRQHVTIAGGFNVTDCESVGRAISEMVVSGTSFRYRLGAPFVGNKNFGRIYFPAYPLLHGESDVFGELQIAVGGRRTGFYAMGYYNFTDELTVDETMELQAILDQSENSTVLEKSPPELWILATNDDLVLSSRVLSRIGTSIPKE